MPGTMEELKAHLDETVKGLSETLRQRDDEVKALGVAKSETAKKIEKFDSLLTEINAGIAATNKALDETKSRLDQIEVESKRFPSTGQGRTPQDLGSLVTESPQFKRMIESRIRESGKIPVDRYNEDHFVPQTKTISSANASAGYLINPYRPDRIAALPEIPGNLLSLIRREPCSEGAAEFNKMSYFYPLKTVSTSQSAAGQKDVVVSNICGFYAGQTVILDPDSAAESCTVASLTDPSEGSAGGTLTMVSNLSGTHASGIKVVSAMFAFTPELMLKPEADFKFTISSVPIKTLAHWVPISRQMLNDVPRLRSFINTRLVSSHARSLEKQILSGSGATEELTGIFSDADIQSVNWSTMPSGTSKMDAIRRSSLLVALTGLKPTDVCLYPTDLAEIEISKGQDGHYIWMQAQSSAGVTMMWRMRVHEVFGLGAGTALVANFTDSITLFDREATEIRFSEHHANFFVENKVALLVEERLGLGIEVPQAFVKLTFNSAPL